MTTFKVYHTKNFSVNAGLHFKKHMEDYKPLKSDYELVAYVECDKLGETFHLTNHIDYAWWENEGVTKVKESRSTSVGDLVEDVKKDELYVCCSVGWEKVKWM